jgi:hypothetical protein
MKQHLRIIKSRESCAASEDRHVKLTRVKQLFLPYLDKTAKIADTTPARVHQITNKRVDDNVNTTSICCFLDVFLERLIS